MGRRKSFSRIEVRPLESRPASWTFAGQPVSGVEHVYDVLDGNYEARNRWQFVVRVPRASGRVEVRPVVVPNLQPLATLDRRSLTFTGATKGGYRGQLYCPVALADPSGERSRRVVNQALKANLPSWFDELSSRLKRKETVRPTRGTDANALVLLVEPNDHEQMIRLYFATKVWVLREQFHLD